MRTATLATVAAALTVGWAAPAAATPVPFSGTSFNINTPAAPGAPCVAPLLNLTFGPANTGGTSSLGHFTYTQAHCALGGPGAYGGGVFQYFFDAGDMLGGTYTGVLSASATAGVLNNVIDYSITSGTGRFLNATGTISGVGTLDVRQPPARADLVLNGLLDLQSVPEPSTVSLLFVGVAAVVRRMRRTGAPTGTR